MARQQASSEQMDGQEYDVENESGESEGSPSKRGSKSVSNMDQEEEMIDDIEDDEVIVLEGDN